MTNAMSWVVYCVLASGILALGAFALEGAARATGRGGRWSWIAALIASVVVPVLAWLRPVHIAMPDASLTIEPITTIATAAAASPAVTPSHTNFVLIFYATATLLVLGAVALSYVKLFFMRRTWTRANVNDVPVLLSYDVGPAALGVVSGEIVLPRWVLALEKRALSLMLLHEREHLRAGDPRLMLGSLLLVAIMPWNPVMWLMVHRLRLAIELDCDARVLTADPDPVAYGAVLIEVGRRRAGSTLALSTFAEPRPHLEKRIRRMAEWPGNRKIAHAALLGVAALSLTGGAYAMRTPTSARVIYDGPATSDVARGDTVAPRLNIGNDAKHREWDALYPEKLSKEGLAAIVRFKLFVAPTGKAQKFEITAGSTEQFSVVNAAIRVVQSADFSPAVYGGHRIGMWVSGIEVRFEDAHVHVRQTYRTMSVSPNGEDTTFTIREVPPPPRAPNAPPPPPRIIPRGDAPPPPPTAPRTPPAPRAAPAPPSVGGISKAPPPPPVEYRGKTGTISGRVTMGGSTGVNSATVQLLNTNLVGVTDRDGNYRIEKVPAGSHTVRVQSVGARVTDVRVEVVPSSTTTLNLVLETRAMELGQLSISATGNPNDVPPPGARTQEPSSAVESSLSAAPVFTPFTVKPRLLNQEEVEKAVARFYPPLLREAGIGGKTKVWFFIDENGRSIKQTINTPSGYDALDQAALKIAPVLRFTPAMNIDQKVPVWVAIDIVFYAKKPVEN